MQRYHISEDGQPRPCDAESAASCRLGEGTSHIESDSPAEISAFAESVNAERFGAGHLSGASKPANQGSPEAKAELEELLRDEDGLDGALDHISDNILGDDDGEVKSFLANSRYSYGSVRNAGGERIVTITAGEHGGFADKKSYRAAAERAGQKVSESLSSFFGQKTTVSFAADELSED